MSIAVIMYFVCILIVMIGATEVLCSSMEEVMSCLEQGAAYRSTASTQMNDHSSRSHSIFTIYLGMNFLFPFQTYLYTVFLSFSQSYPLCIFYPMIIFYKKLL